MAIFTGKNVEEAISVGLNQLGIPRLKARIKVISKEKKGFLGLWRRPAQVEVSLLEDAQALDKKSSSVTSIFKERPRSTAELDEKTLLTKAPENANEQVQATEAEEVVVETRAAADVQSLEVSKVPVEVVETAEAIVVPENQEGVDEEATQSVQNQANEEVFAQFVAKEFTPETETSSVEATQELQEAASQVTAYVQNIINEMDVESSIETTTNRRHINLQIETAEPGRVIGYHGKVLKSLQLLAQNYLHDRYSRHYSISINVHDYVQHRTEALIEFTHKIANRVLDSGEPYHMDPMSNSERKTVHKTVALIEGVVSYSEGDDPNRYVVVTLEES